jgi:RNA polymerase sigma factor (TIGR02999 family)
MADQGGDRAGRERVTELLQRPMQAGQVASSELLVLVYDQLRAIAQQRMNEERREHTLEATALVHEAYLRLVGSGQGSWSGRAHFFAAAAEAMRRILIEHARSRAAAKRGGLEGKAPKRTPINLLDLASHDDPDQMLMLDEALQRMEAEEPEVGAVVRLRFFAGLSGDETAKLLGVSPSTVDRHWAWARATLFKALTSGQGQPPRGAGAGGSR